jgi:hypothetical protein
MSPTFSLNLRQRSVPEAMTIGTGLYIAVIVVAGGIVVSQLLAIWSERNRR